MNESKSGDNTTFYGTATVELNPAFDKSGILYKLTGSGPKKIALVILPLVILLWWLIARNSTPSQRVETGAMKEVGEISTVIPSPPRAKEEKTLTLTTEWQGVAIPEGFRIRAKTDSNIKELDVRSGGGGEIYHFSENDKRELPDGSYVEFKTPKGGGSLSYKFVPY